MTTIQALSEAECRILAVLNEAGEEYVTALANSAMRASGEQSQWTGYIQSLQNLASMFLVEFANLRDERSLEWTVLSAIEAATRLSDASENVKWSSEDVMWKWESSEPRLAVLLTSRGQDVSKSILREYGWKMSERQ